MNNGGLVFELRENWELVSLICSNWCAAVNWRRLRSLLSRRHGLGCAELVMGAMNWVPKVLVVEWVWIWLQWWLMLWCDDDQFERERERERGRGWDGDSNIPLQKEKGQNDNFSSARLSSAGAGSGAGAGAGAVHKPKGPNLSLVYTRKRTCA